MGSTDGLNPQARDHSAAATTSSAHQLLAQPANQGASEKEYKRPMTRSRTRAKLASVAHTTPIQKRSANETIVLSDDDEPNSPALDTLNVCHLTIDPSTTHNASSTLNMGFIMFDETVLKQAENGIAIP